MKNNNTIVLFLDCDGVINNEKFFQKLVHNEIDPESMTLLNNLVEETNISIVISSTWRLDYSLYIIQNLFKENGFKYSDNIIGATPYCSGKTKDFEIQTWLNKVSVDAFIIFDDDDTDSLQDYLIKTQFEYGLLKEHIEKAKVMINAQLNNNI